MRIPKIILPILVLIFVAGGYFLQSTFFFPTTETVFGAVGDSEVEFTVDGVRCRGTASFFESLFQKTPGIESITTYAANGRAIFKYNSAEITPDRIKSIFEKEIRMRDGSFRRVFKEIDRTER